MNTETALLDQENIDAEVSVSNSMMGQMTTMLGSGLEIDISGTSMEALKTASEQVKEVLNEVPGFKNVKNGLEDTEPELRLLIDKDKARRCGATEAQLYQLITEKLTTEKSAVTLSIVPMKFWNVPLLLVCPSFP